MPHVRIVLIEPLNDGNVGAVARSMKNFGVDELVLVRPCEIGEEAVKRAMHAVDLLRSARTVSKEEDALEGADYIVGTSGIDTSNDKKFSRISMSPKAFVEKIHGCDGTIAVLFGREDFGLSNDMVRRCDFLVTIPANPDYSILNISHAAAIVMYELFAHGLVRDGPKKASELEMEKLNEYFSRLLDAIDYPAHKKKKTCVMFRRMMARSVPSTWEFHTMMGVLDEAAKRSSSEREQRR